MTKKWKQQVHKDCGGEIIVIALGKSWQLCCKTCLLSWVLQSPTYIEKLPKDFVNTK